MELGSQIKKYRGQLKLSQEALAEKIYVTRQTISNWETEKSYPDVHSLLLLSNLFGVSLDDLIKGDIEMMKAEVNKEEVRKLNSLSWVYTALLLACIILPMPLAKLLGWIGMGVYLVLLAVTMVVAFRIEKIKKVNNVQTYREILAFTRGERLDEIASYREEGKRLYQKILGAVICGLLALAVCALFAWLLY